MRLYVVVQDEARRLRGIYARVEKAAAHVDDLEREGVLAYFEEAILEP